MNNSIILTTIQLKLLCTLRNRHKTKSQQSGSDLYLNGKPLTDNLMPPQPDALTARSDLSGLSGKPGSLVISLVSALASLFYKTTLNAMAFQSSRRPARYQVCARQAKSNYCLFIWREWFFNCFYGSKQWVIWLLHLGSSQSPLLGRGNIVTNTLSQHNRSN